MKQLSVFLGIALVLPILAADSNATVVKSRTQRVELPAGGSIRFANSSGELTIEGWDQPAVEITVTKSIYIRGRREKKPLDTSGDLAAPVASVKTEGNTLLIGLGRGEHDVDLEYSIKIPRAARLEINHDHGEVNIAGVTGDIHATSRYGPIVLRLPADGHYAIDAHCRIGSVYSDFSGDEKRHHLFGESFAGAESAAPQKLNLKVGMGDVIILKTRER